MTNMMDYILWRGDLSMTVDPFNEVDALILSWLAYAKLEGIVPEQGSISMESAAAQYQAQFPEPEEASKWIPATQCPPLVFALGKSRRFAPVLLSNWCETSDPTLICQFAAMTATLETGEVCVCYRGTDGTLLGWREDFYMSCLDTVPAQKMALEYLQRVAASTEAPLHLMGHSKGGNLAMYAAATAPITLESRIQAIINHDGPGFSNHLAHSAGYLGILPKLTTIVPQASIVGMLLSHAVEYTIVESDEKGIMAHNPLSWTITGKTLVHVQERTKFSLEFDDTLTNWLFSMDDERTQAFIDLVFDALMATGAKTLDDLYHLSPLALQGILAKLSKAPAEERKMAGRLMMTLVKTSQQTLTDTVKAAATTGLGYIPTDWQHPLKKVRTTYQSIVHPQDDKDGGTTNE